MTKKIHINVEELKQIIDERVTKHEQFASKSLDEILRTVKLILIEVRKHNIAQFLTLCST